jgi:hypothetical protein
MLPGDAKPGRAGTGDDRPAGSSGIPVKPFSSWMPLVCGTCSPCHCGRCRGSGWPQSGAGVVVLVVVVVLVLEDAKRWREACGGPVGPPNGRESLLEDPMQSLH